MTESGESDGQSAPPQLSPDGLWWWTGAEWIPADQRPPEPARAPDSVPAAAWSAPDVAAQPPTYDVTPEPDPRSGGGRRRGVIAVVAVVVMVLAGVAAAILVPKMRDDGTHIAVQRPVRMSFPPTADPDGADEEFEEPDISDPMLKTLYHAAVAQESWWIDHSAYTAKIADLLAEGLAPEVGTELRITRASEDDYCMVVTSPGRQPIWLDGSEESGPSETRC